MYESITAFLKKWSTSTTERQKLQHVYALLFIILIIASGLITLLEPSTGRQILDIAFYSLALFIINAVTWALVQSFVLNRLPARRTSNRNTK